MTGMQIIRPIAEMQEKALALRRTGQRIGFVATLGYLHEGHASLVRIARQRADVVVVSVFVNPTQFGPHEDFSQYPRDFARDEEICREAGADIVFYPSVEAMYAPDHSVYAEDESLSRFLCGASRPGHFRGVCTIVSKLFNLVLPDLSVFGAKDAQQVRIIRRLVRDLNFPVEIIEGPTLRESDGLAMSSRNALLTADERSQATGLRRALDRAEKMYRAGERDADLIAREMKKVITQAPSARIDYVQVVDNETLQPVIEIERPALVAVAVKFSKTRLIDNTVLA
jgi:pantoate--beta-alanine ligase